MADGYLVLLVHTVTVTNPVAAAGTDIFGNPNQGETSVDEPARVQARTSEEELTSPVSRDTRVTAFRIFLRSDTAATGLSTFTWEGRTLRAVGEPRRYDGRTAPHHVECDAEEVLG